MIFKGSTPVSVDRGILIFIAGSLIGATSLDRILVRKIGKVGAKPSSLFDLISGIVVSTQLYQEEEQAYLEKSSKDEDHLPGTYL